MRSEEPGSGEYTADDRLRRHRRRRPDAEPSCRSGGRARCRSGKYSRLTRCCRPAALDSTVSLRRGVEADDSAEVELTVRRASRRSCCRETRADVDEAGEETPAVDDGVRSALPVEARGTGTGARR